VLLLAVTCFSSTIYATAKWELKKNQNGIKVYTALFPNSSIKAVRVECQLQGTITQLAALLLDIKAHEKWVYTNETSYTIQKLADNEIIYYAAMDLSWPLSDRDAVIRIKLTQDSLTKALHVSSTSLPGYVPIKKDKVRVPLIKIDWTATPVSNNTLQVVYEAQADPGGVVPAWAVNMFATKGPYETFLALNSLLNSGAYKGIKVPFVKE